MNSLSYQASHADQGIVKAKAAQFLGRWLVPSHSDWLFGALLAWLFAAGNGWSGLLADGDTGWHLRTGEYILSHGAVPRADLFSFSKPGAPWYAWEWLSDVVFALAWREWALKGVVLLAGVVIAVYLLVLFRYLLWRGANLFIALGVCLLVAGASGMHYLARPHIFTLLLFTVSVWILDRDRWRRDRVVWWLVPLTALWANLHAGFVAILASIAVSAVGAVCEGRWRDGRRYAVLAGATAAATVVNPYGIALHRHLIQYLRSDWIREVVDEFQSPRFRSEGMLYFEILLFAGLIAAGLLFRRRRFAEGGLVVLWAHAALVSVRHVPLFAIVAAPVVVSEAARCWEAWVAPRASRSIPAVLDGLARDLASGARRTSLIPAVLVIVLALGALPVAWPKDFPAVMFPLETIGKQAGVLRGSRVFTFDQWADYLIYRFYPAQRVFFDGRSDFFGPELGKRYLHTIYGHPDWRKTLDQYAISAVLAKPEWPLTELLRHIEGWRVVQEDRRSVLFQRLESGLKKTPESTEVCRRSR